MSFFKTIDNWLCQLKLVRMLLGDTWLLRCGMWHQAWIFKTCDDGTVYYMVHRDDLFYDVFHGTSSCIEAKEVWW